MAKAPKKTLSHREIFGRNLRTARHMRQWSQETLAFKADISPTYLSEVERGLRNLSIDNMGLLADALEIPLHDLVNPQKFTIDNA